MTAAILAAVVAAAGALAAVLAWWVERRRATALQARLERSLVELEKLQHSFSRFVPADVVDEIATRGTALRGEKKEVTVMFADLQGFTAMSEKLDPAVLVDVLNGYFKAMSTAIASHHGHVSKFIGDGIMAFFGALETNPWQHNDAVHAALAMRAALAAYNRELAARALPELRVGIGIHKGTVVAGLIGSDQLTEFTLIGDTVNVAARIESLTRQHGVDILITGSVQAGLDPRFQLRSLPPTPVKGKSEPIATFAVASDSEASAAGA